MAFTTNMTLLEKITDGDEVSWLKFSEIYSPLIRLCGKDWGLSIDERNELVQDVLINFFKASKTFKYDRSRGHFRSYLRTIVKNCTLAIIKKRPQPVEGIEANDNLIDCAFQERWDVEWHNCLLREALQKLQDELEPIAYQSFYLYVIQNQSPQQVADQLGISVNAVYINKSRTLGQLRLTVRQLEKL